MLKLLYIELHKIRRSLAVFMLFAIPFMVVGLNTLMLARRPGFDKVTDAVLERYWMGNTALWCYFMLPLYIALVAGLLNGHEHKHTTWRLMMTLPIRQAKLFIAKCALVWLFALAATAILAGGAAGVIAALGGPMVAGIGGVIGKIALASLPIVVLQHAVSWRFPNIVAPLAFGVMATLGITQIGSSENWVYYPWTYPMMAAVGTDPAMRSQAILLALSVGFPLLAAATFHLGRREIAA